MQIIKKTELVELNFGASAPGNLTQINFRDQPQLENATIYGLEAQCSTEVAQSPTGKTMIEQDDLKKLTLNVVAKGSNEVVLKDIPLYTLNPTLNGGLIRALQGLQVDWQKSYIKVLDSTGLADNESVCFNVQY